MALFNYAKTFKNTDKDKDVSQYVGITSGDNYVRFFITGDGHIVSHGVDFIPWTNVGDRRFLSNQYLNITTDTTSPAEGTLWASTTTKSYVDAIQKTLQDKINALQGDAMQIKGTISTGTVSGKYSINGGADVDFPATPTVGDTYRVIKAGTYNGIPCEVGDLIICTEKATSDTAATWTVAQANINGSTSHTINGVQYTVYTTDPGKTFALYAPTTAGTKGQLLVSTAGTPTWATPSMAYNATTDVLSYSFGTITGSLTLSSRRAVSVNSKEVLAKSVTTALDLCNGTGINVAFASNKVTFSVGTNYTTNEVQRNFAVKADASNNLYVNVPFVVYDVVTSTANGLAPKVINTNTAFINSAYYILASSDGTTTPSWYKLPTTAFKDTWRDIKINNTSIGTNTLNLVAGNKITLGNSNGTVTVSSSWRSISVGDTSIGDKALRFMPTGNIYVKTADEVASTADTFDVGFGIAWYNIETGTYEYVD